MLRALPLLVASSFLFFAACAPKVSGGGGGGSDGVCSVEGTGPDGKDPAEITTCEEVSTELDNEMMAIRCCTTDAECGQTLSGIGCGCTHDPVARIDADATRYDALIKRYNQLCEGLSGTCDCPAANGFICKSGTCTWNYTN